MLTVQSRSSGTLSLPSSCHILCLIMLWMWIAQARPGAAFGDYAQSNEGAGNWDLIPSIGQDHQSSTATGALSSGDTAGLIPTGGLPPLTIPSQLPQQSTPIQTPSALVSITPAPASSNFVPIPTAPPGQIPSVPMPIGSAPISSNATPSVSRTLGGTSVMSSTDEGLKPVPPAATQTGDPNGHHEITEPNFSATKTCRGCSPVFEVTATGWIDGPAEEQQGTTPPAQATIPAGLSNILISQAPTGGGFVIGGSTTVTAGQTITVDNTPIAIHTTAGVEVVVGTAVVPIAVPDDRKTTKWEGKTPTPVPPVLTIGSETIIANAQTQYIVSGQTLSPGGAAITVSGTTLSLAPSATAVIVNGATSSLVPNFGYIFTTAAPVLTFNNQLYTVNRAGYITLSPGVVLKPGGDPVTVNGTTLSLDHSGTAIIIQGSTSILQPVSTVVTLTKSFGAGGHGNAGYTSGGSWTSPTGKSELPAKPVSGASLTAPSFPGSESLLGWLVVFSWLWLNFMAIGS